MYDPFRSRAPAHPGPEGSLLALELLVQVLVGKDMRADAERWAATEQEANELLFQEGDAVNCTTARAEGVLHHLYFAKRAADPDGLEEISRLWRTMTVCERLEAFDQLRNAFPYSAKKAGVEADRPLPEFHIVPSEAANGSAES